MEMKNAFEKRAAMKKPACAPKATSKAAPNATVKAGGKTVAKTTLKEASKRPSMIPKGGPTCHYLTGKVLSQ